MSNLYRLKKEVMRTMKNLIKLGNVLIKGALLAVMLMVSPVMMHEAQDIYLVNIAAPKASPVIFNGRIVASSSQVKYKGKRYTLTNQHVCRINERLFMNRSSYVPNEDLIGTEMVIGDRVLKILAISKEHDLCILEPDLEKSAFMLAYRSDVNEQITLIGHPRGLPQTIREGRIISEQKSAIPWIERGILTTQMISATSYPGNSGSPVINRFGNLVGVLFAGQRGIHTEALIVPLEDVKRFLNNYEANSSK